ncbi:hypothetical protein CQA18_26465, partial [Enterobacter hormaechei]
WVYERYPAVDGALPYTIDSKTGEVKWKYQVENKPDDKPKLEVASWLEEFVSSAQRAFGSMNVILP